MRRTGVIPALLLFGGGFMISVWWLVPAVMIGAFVGIALIAICSANWTDEERNDQDEQH